MAIQQPGFDYRPFADDELNQLGALMGQLQPTATGAPEPPAPVVAPLTPPEDVSVPAGSPGEQAVATSSAGAAPAMPAPPPAFQLPPQPEPVDVAFPTQRPQVPRGLEASGVAYEGLPDAEREKLVSLHQQMADQRGEQIDRFGRTEASILDRQRSDAQGRIESANLEVNKNRMALAGQESAKRKLEAEGREWAAMKEDPSKAWEGREWAGILTVLGMAGGTFAQAMGWQQGNPVQQMFDNVVERNLAAQRERKGSMLDNIRERIGDAQAAEGLLRAQLHDAIADRAEAERAKAATQDAYDRLGGIIDAERQKSQEAVVAAYQSMVTRETRQFERPRQDPSAGKGKTPVEMLSDLLKLRDDMQKAGYDEADPKAQRVDKAIASVHASVFGGPENPRAEGAAPTGTRADTREAEGAQYQNQPAFQAADDTILHLADTIGLGRDKGTGEFTGVGLRPGSGTETLPGLQRFLGMNTPGEDAMDQAVTALQRATGISKAEAQQLIGVQTLTNQGTYTTEQAASRLNNVRRWLRSQMPPGRAARDESAAGQGIRPTGRRREVP